MSGEDIAAALARQDNEIDDLKARVKDCENRQETIHEIALSVNQLAVNMQHMLNEQKEQGKRLTALEKQPLERLTLVRNEVIKCLISSLLGALLGAVMALVFH